MPEPKLTHDRDTNRFLLEVETEIIRANREQIKERIPRLSLDDFRMLARVVARLRAEYLEASLAVDWTLEGVESSGLKARRALYEEGLAAFEALQRAIQRDYIEF